MYTQLQKAMRLKQIVTIVYITKDGTLSKRRIKISHLHATSFQAYCYTRRAKRTFLIENVLAIQPVTVHEKLVI